MRKSTALIWLAVFTLALYAHALSPKNRCLRSGGEWVETPRKGQFPKLECRKKL